MHESTISRATRNKYVQTPHGLFEMKSFFSNAVSTTEDEAVSTKRKTIYSNANWGRG